jgi:hypothetical protein
MTALGITIADGPGSPEFRRQAAEWSRSPWGGPVVELKVGSLKPALRFVQVADAIATHGAPDHLAIFCHGWANGLQLVPMARVKDLAWALAPKRPGPGPVVTLYACSAADGPHLGGDGGFADTLRDALCEAGATTCCVDAHTTAGHTTRNPYVRRFVGPTPATGGEYIVEPKSPLWRPWVKALSGPMRWEFPALGVDVIRSKLATL